MVLSGRTDEIHRATDILCGEGIRTKKLPVSAAFHSTLVAGAAEPFAEHVKRVNLKKSAVAVYANATGTRYPATSVAARKVLSKQLASPVDFVQCVKAMFDDGVRTFVEIGPGRRLTGLIKEILADEEITVVAIDASSGQHPGLLDLARTLAQLAAAGHTVALDRWDEGALEAWRHETAREKPALTVKISGANHVTERPKRPPRAAAATGVPMGPPTTAAPVAATPSALDPTAAVGSDPQVLAEAMRASQASLAALVRLQEQTAAVHRQFLESQERTIQAIIQHQGLAAPGEAATTAIPSSPPSEIHTETPVEAPVAALGNAVGEARVASNPDVAAALLSVVSEKTGYPEEMLDLSMGLDADLGIDSIKRVEILAALQERLPEAPAITPEHLGEIQTLGQIVDFLGGPAGPSEPDAPAVDFVTPDPKGADAPTNGVVADPANGASDSADIAAVLLGVVAEKTGYPVDMLDVSMNLDADLGIDSIKRVEILSALQEVLPGAPVVAPDQLGELRTLSQIVDLLSDGAKSVPGSSSPETAGQIERFVPTLHPVQDTGDPIGLPAGSKIWVTKSGDVLSGQIVEELSAQGFAAEEIELCDEGDDPPDELAGLIVVVPPQVTDEDILFGFGRMRAMAPALRRAALQGGARLGSVTDLGGVAPSPRLHLWSWRRHVGPGADGGGRPAPCG